MEGQNLPATHVQAIEAIAAKPLQVDERVSALISAADRAIIVSAEAKKANPPAGAEGHRPYLGTMEDAADLDKQLQVQVKKLEDQRLVLAGPLDKALKAWNGMYKSVRDRLDLPKSTTGARQILDRKMKDYRLAEMKREQERAAAEQKAREEAALKEAQEKEEAARKLAAEGKAEEARAVQAEAEQVLQDAADAPPPAPAMAAGPVRGDFGGTSSFREEWQLKAITDPDAVPREFCSPDEKKIKDELKRYSLTADVSIPGCTIVKDLAKRTG